MIPRSRLLATVLSAVVITACSSGDDAADTTVDSVSGAASTATESTTPATTAPVTTAPGSTAPDTTATASTGPETTAPASTGPTTTVPNVPPVTQPSVVDGKVFLPLVPRLGDAVEQTTVQEIVQTITDPDGADVTVRTNSEIVTERVVVATTASTYTVSETVTSATIEFPDDATQSEAATQAFDTMVGAEVVITYGLDGVELDRQVNAADDLDPVARQSLEAVSAVTVATPESGAAAGDSWDIATDGTSLGVAAEITTTFTLTSLDGESYATASSAEIDAADLFGSMFDSVDGSMKIDSTSAGSFANALDVDGTSDVVVDADLTSGGQTGHLEQVQSIVITSTPL